MTTLSAKMEATRVDLLRRDSDVSSRRRCDRRRDLISYYNIAMNARGRIDLRTGQLVQREHRRSLVR